MGLLDHNENREATNFLRNKYNDFSVLAKHPKIVGMECSPFIFQEYARELEALYNDGFSYPRFVDLDRTDSVPFLNFKAARLTANSLLENHEVTITFMSETKVKL